MASVHLIPLSIRLPDFAAGAKNYRNSATFTSKKTPISVSFALSSPESAPEVPEKPEIELEFIGPRPGDDGKYPMEREMAVSGEKLLRNIMLDEKIELYAPYGKVMNCGGGGSCGTCIVEEESEVIKGIHESYRRASGQLINTEKSSIFFSTNTPAARRMECKEVLGFSNNSEEGKYLGLPFIIGRSMNAALMYIKDRV